MCTRMRTPVPIAENRMPRLQRIVLSVIRTRTNLTLYFTYYSINACITFPPVKKNSSTSVYTNKIIYSRKRSGSTILHLKQSLAIFKVRYFPTYWSIQFYRALRYLNSNFYQNSRQFLTIVVEHLMWYNSQVKQNNRYVMLSF